MKIQRFLNDNIKLKEEDKYPTIGLRNVKTHYNNYKGDVMFTFYNFTEGEECKYGTYKITDLFFTDSYFSNKFGLQTNKGGVYYADYDSVNNKLTVHKSNAEMSYFFTSDDVVLEYDSVNKSFSISDPVSFNANPYSEYNKAGVIYNYEAEVYVAPDPGAGGVNPLAAAVIGTYTESGFSGYPAPGTLVISATDDPSKGDLRVKFGFESTVFYAKVSGDASATNLTIAETITTNWGPVSATLTFIPSASYIYGTATYGWGTISTYGASL